MTCDNQNNQTDHAIPDRGGGERERERQREIAIIASSIDFADGISVNL